MIYKSFKKLLMSSSESNVLSGALELHFWNMILISVKTIFKPSSCRLNPSPLLKFGHIIRVLFQEFQMFNESESYPKSS